MRDTAGAPARLEAVDVVKDFPGVRALDGVSLDVRPGEVHALVGENGAGKSTLMHVLAGVVQPDSGTLRMDGGTVSFPTPHAAATRGIGVVFQELSLADDLAICENVFANRQPVGALGLVDRAALRRRTADMLALFDWHIDPETPVRTLSAAKRQVVEILKALSLDPLVVILDEPTSSLTSAEKPMLFDLIRRKRAKGTSFVYITHHLSEVFEFADRVTVLRDGRHVATHMTGAVSERDLIRDMVGRDLQDLYGIHSGSFGADRLMIRGASRGESFRDISLAVRSGEIVGLAGLAGAGRTELARGIFGAEPLDRGDIQLDGSALRAAKPADAVAAGLAYITESRKADGLFLDMAIRDNCAAVGLDRFAAAAGLIDDARIRRHAEDMRRRFAIAAPDVDREVGHLSGGNQQKVLFAMWAGGSPRAIIADEPTRGVDVGARSEIYEVMRGLAADGVAILLISCDLIELLGMCDRILVMRAGRLVGEFTGADATEERIISCAAGVTPGPEATHD